MMIVKKLLNEKILPEVSRIALALFWISVASGVVLAFQYSPFGNVFKNVQDITYSYPYGFFIRGVHYWSAQFFLVFTLFHIADHFIKKSYRKGKGKRWIYLALSTVSVFFCFSQVLS